TRGDTHRATVLLRAGNPVGHPRIRRQVIDLRGGLVEPRAPGWLLEPRVLRDDRALIAGRNHAIRVVWCVPSRMVVAPAGRSSRLPPGPAAVGRVVDRGVRNVDAIRVPGIDG